LKEKDALFFFHFSFLSDFSAVDKHTPRIPHITPFLAFRSRIQDSLSTVLKQSPELQEQHGPLLNISKLEIIKSIMVCTTNKQNRKKELIFFTNTGRIFVFYFCAL
jgi:hypothetical protein